MFCLSPPLSLSLSLSLSLNSNANKQNKSSTISDFYEMVQKKMEYLWNVNMLNDALYILKKVWCKT